MVYGIPNGVVSLRKKVISWKMQIHILALFLHLQNRQVKTLVVREKLIIG